MPKRVPRRKKAPLSLAPLGFQEAVEGLLGVKPPPRKRRKAKRQ